MALENSNNFFNSVRGAMGLFSGVNKSKKPLEEDGADFAQLPEFESSMSDEEISKLTSRWTSEYQTYAKDIEQQQKDNVNYWIGKQNSEIQTAGVKKPLVDNLLFEAIETFLPIATRGNPQAIVTSDASQEASQVAKKVEKGLVYQADRQHLRMKLKGVTRNWVLYLVGAVKIVWDTEEDDMDTKVILPTRLILDPHAEIEVGGVYKGDYLGERKKRTARKLIKMFPKKEKIIKSKVDGNLGTKVAYIEWWTPENLFFTIDKDVIGKFKNPHFNYEKPAAIDPMTGMEQPGQEVHNHFKQPQIPYLFLTIFNLGKRPHDETNLIQQNIGLQDQVNRRYQQIDRNVESQNNGVVLSGKHFTKEQAAEAATQLSRGNPLWVPEGDIGDSYKRDVAPSLSGDVFRNLEDTRDEIRNIFGTSGSTPEGTESQKSVRGKILINQLDSSRIGGGVTEYIEALANSIYNWYVQMMYVYYTDEHKFSLMGKKETEDVSISTQELLYPLHVTVKEGSLIPKDPLTKRNEAMDLWSAGAIAPIPFYSALDYPNPYESAKELVTWQMIQKGALPPQIMFPDLQQPMPPQMGGAPGQPVQNAVNAQEAQRGINPVEAGAVQPASPTGQQLIQSVPLPGV